MPSSAIPPPPSAPAPSVPPSAPRDPLLRPLPLLFVALSLSIGWGVRGNWGHEFGAMIPGALAALAACLLSGREDWRARAPWFGFLGALGWSFGGSISYMQVIGFTHSGHGPSVLYGFASLFWIGFLWGAVGGAGTALPAFLERRRLAGLLPPILAVFGAWFAQGIVMAVAFARAKDPDALEEALDWFDTDWIAAGTALVALLGLSAARRRVCEATSLCLHLTLGWWAGFLILTVTLGLRMTPPRGDNWAGMTGLVAGMFVFFVRRGWGPATLAGLVAGIVGGFGFSFGQFLKLAQLASSAELNFHSILEQTYGFVNGIGIALAMALVARRVPDLDRNRTGGNVDEDERARFARGSRLCVGFLLLVVPWLNISKNMEAVWLDNRAVGETLYGVSSNIWFQGMYLALGATVLTLIVRARRPLPMLPASALGRGQLLYLLFLWWIVIGNLSRYFPFAEGRLVTEGAIHLNACLCTLWIVLLPREDAPFATPDSGPDARDDRRLAARLALAGVALLALSSVAHTIGTRAIHGTEHVRNSGLHVRFGPDATTGRR